jgi:hypothetical protein
VGRWGGGGWGRGLERFKKRTISQFCDAAEVVIIHEKILPYLAI